MRTTIWRRVSAAERRLETYEVAYLAGGPQRVLETALFALRDREAITMAGRRVRAVGEDDSLAEHPVERAVLVSCPRGRSLAVVATALRDGPEVAEIKRELIALGLLTRLRHRLTRAGASRLEAARREAALPAYVFDGPPAHQNRRLRRIVAATSIPSGLGRSLIRMGKSTDPDHDDNHAPDATTDSGGFSCGSGGGGGGGGD
ncbi:TIGR04222 domain-containing membrane protein [Streptomyces sp. NPDC050433]|uniref:TIGR04222 domain-containing membrane protein n=1 Tax=unclassified Streptomyces TaxID=2593676 RepID=UPI003421131E